MEGKADAASPMDLSLRGRNRRYDRHNRKQTTKGAWQGTNVSEPAGRHAIQLVRHTIKMDP